MCYTALRATLLALATVVSAVAASLGLNLQVTGAETIDGVKNFKVVAGTRTNTGDETLKLLNDPRGALNPLHADTFIITANGSSPRFTAVGAKYPLDSAAKMTDVSAVTVLVPGQFISVTHDLSSAYDFTGTGHGTCTMRASNLFHCVATNNNASSLHPTSSTSHIATLTGGALALARPPRVVPRLVKRAQFTGCSSSQQSALNVTAPVAQNYTAGALAYLVHNTFNLSAARYMMWLGAQTDERYGVAVGHCASINSHDFTTFTYDCACTKTALAFYIH